MSSNRPRRTKTVKAWVMDKYRRRTKTIKAWVMDKYRIRTNDNIYQVLDTSSLPQGKSFWALIKPIDFCNWAVLKWIPL